MRLQGWALAGSVSMAIGLAGSVANAQSVVSLADDIILI